MPCSSLALLPTRLIQNENNANGPPMKEEFIPTLSHATERDVDLLLVEEFYASLPFAKWVLNQLHWTIPVVGTNVLHSKKRTRSRREIDIFVEMRHPDNTTSAIMIENKLDAQEQPDQAESYQEEAEALKDKYATVASVIVCPEDYAEQKCSFTSKFDHLITYENLAKYFRAAAETNRTSSFELAQRQNFRADLIEQAVFKHRRGYTPILNEELGNFKAQYVNLLADCFPNLLPGKNLLASSAPDLSRSLFFDHAAIFAELPIEVRPKRFTHEAGTNDVNKVNCVAVTFKDWGKALPTLKDQLKQDTKGLGGVDFRAKKARKDRPRPGLTMAIATDDVDHLGNFEEQKGNIIKCMRKAEELRSWLVSNQAILLRWKHLIDD